MFTVQFCLTLGYFLRTPDNSNLFSISLEGSSYRESTVRLKLWVNASNELGKQYFWQNLLQIDPLR